MTVHNVLRYTINLTTVSSFQMTPTKGNLYAGEGDDTTCAAVNQLQNSLSLLKKRDFFSEFEINLAHSWLTTATPVTTPFSLFRYLLVKPFNYGP